MIDKAVLRKQLRRARMSLPRSVRTKAARLVAKRILRAGYLRKFSRIAFYWPVGSELDTRPLAALARSLGRELYLPRIARHRRLRFDVWNGRVPHRKNCHGIQEPRPLNTLLPRQIELVVLPLVGFDQQCRRLGQGGGYYDSSFAYRARAAAIKRPFLLGLAFECQRAEVIPCEPWDIRLDAVISERRHYRRGFPA
ncbi:5-formyltetrahydrofolate cyclo-ligase [Parachitinimonas caeni]|uniref:5-formyltetrahydrofolate cyclo-ligase n=1 Tax=Parachitinimonas caeni TaxID=3031301 RepID=A0ABT7DVF3_9NEIS|nr:5-formyltetrahydrofolate cyclo-ligase [Parachitinimonas caeni]MDK2122622.1 5-formyltetrahydrofolate cyclo-ligase [Parachitinimonas caeni]